MRCYPRDPHDDPTPPGPRHRQLVGPILMMRPMLVVVAALATMPSALAAGPFDGSWTGTAISYSNLSSPACKGTVTATAVNNTVTGTMQSEAALRHLSGTIADYGVFNGKVDQFAVTGKFSASLFTGSFVGSGECGLEQIFLSRSGIPD